jgi:GNAT superfamily N-acetyltransferase
MQFDAQRRDYEQRHPNARCRIIEWHRCPVGRLWVVPDERSLTVLDISLVPEARGQGIGGDCLRRVQRRAAAAGRDVELQVVAGNPARRLYERLGFRDVGAAGVRQSMAWTPWPSAAPRTNPSEEMHHEQA